MQGKIVKGIAGFYYVHQEKQGIYECKAKGIFRKNDIKPLVGDDALLEVLDEKEKLGNITDILPRRNALVRPAVANVDQAIVFFAIVKPNPNYNLLDRFLIVMEKQGLDCVICFNKKDIATGEERDGLKQAYEGCGKKVLFVSVSEQEGVDEVASLLRGKTTVLAGPSGAGKSSLINCLQTGVRMETGAISEKIDRGKHTTRHSELITIDDYTYIMDTPGFSTLYLEGIEKEELGAYYSEFMPYTEECRFQGCSHIHEPSCGVRSALAEGKISRVRYDNYVTLYTEIKEKEKRKY